MKKNTLAQLSFAFLFIFGGLHAQAFQTVKNLDLESYLGTWYEIVRMPNSFQDFDKPNPCFNSVAVYNKSFLGQISVNNSCSFYDENSQLKKSSGMAKAFVVDYKNNSKLRVNFVPALNALPLLNFVFSGKYWVIGLGSLNSNGDYSWAVVISPDKRAQYGVSSAWILARDPGFEYSKEFNKALSVLEKNGIPRSVLKPSRR